MHELSEHASFLHDWPEHTFAPANSTSLGDEKRSLSFANTTYVFDGLDVALATAFDEQYGDLSAAPTAEQRSVNLRYCASAGKPFASPQTAGWHYDLALSFDGDSVLMSGMNYVVRLARESLDATILVAPQLSDPLDILENPFRLACAYRLLAMGGIMLHSAGFAHGTQAAVCWGRSGAGKSTLSALAQRAGLQVLSDELNALLPGSSCVRVQAMPFAGDLGRSGAPLQAYDLKGLFFLKQATEPSLSKLGSGRALGTMAAAAPFVNTDPVVHDRLFDALGSLLSGYTAQVLAFPKSQAAAHFVRSEVFGCDAVYDEPS